MKSLNLLGQGISNITSFQQRQYFLSKLSGDYRASYIETLKIDGDCDIDRLQQVIVDFLQNTPIMKSQFDEFEGTPYRFQNDTNDANIIILDEKSAQGITSSERLENILLLENTHRFDLANNPLYRILILLELNKPKYIIINLSKLIFDRESVLGLCKAISLMYTSSLDLNNTIQSPISLATLEKEWISSNEAQKSKAFWNTALKNISKITLDAEKDKSTYKTHNYSSVEDTLSSESIKKYVLKHKISMHSLIASAFSIVLYRYSGHKRFAIGTTFERRNAVNLSQLGPLNEPLPVPFHVRPNELTLTYIKDCDNSITEAGKYSKYPFKRIIDETISSQDVSSTPIFQVEYQHTNLLEYTFCLEDSSIISLLPTLLNYSETDLSLTTFSSHHDILICMQYNKDCISLKYVTHLLNSLIIMLKHITQDTDVTLRKLKIFNSSTPENSLDHSYGQSMVITNNILLHHLYESAIAQNSTRIAVKSDSSSLTYENLNSEANRLSHYILQLQLNKNSKILVRLTRTINYAITALAILKAGHVFVPIDEGCPKERIKYIIEDADINLIITESFLLKSHPETSVKLLCIDTEWEQVSTYSESNPGVLLDQNDLAYMIYTSGTTGNPKAVMISHKSIVNNIMFRQNKWPLTNQDKVLFNTSFNFDPSIWSLFWPISTGAASIITSKTAQSDLRELTRFIISEDITIIGTVPSIIQTVFDQAQIGIFSQLRLILSGGETLTNKVCELVTAKSQAILVNLYGPTETTIDATYFQIDADNIPNVIPIGKPIDNMSAFILDSDLNLVPQGVIGELYIGGIGLSSGYYGKTELTHEKFITNPIIEDGTILYSTGDLVYRDKNYNIHYIGRKDDQVKINGLRIELSEIEKVARNHPAISDAVIVLINGIAAKSLCLCLKVKTSAQIDSSDIKAYLSKWLPEYMIPHRIVFMDEYPKTINGKVDKNEIIRNIQQTNIDQIVSKPTSIIEENVLDDFSKVLGVNNIGIHNNFFELGGTSLQLSKLASCLFNRFSLELPLHSFFKMPTVAGISNVITEIQNSSISEYLAQKHFDQLRTDIYLDPDITPDGLPKADYLNPNSIFLTGATGYLGSFILENLLKKTSAKIYCLVRAKNPGHAIDRIIQSLKEYRIDIKDAENRIFPIVGDLAKPQLGLSDSDWLHLTDVIDVVYHNGAMVNFIYPYSALRAANVESVRIILRLCSQKKLKALHYISSIDSLLSVHAPRPFLEEPSLLPPAGDIPGGYTGSKLVAENIANLARQIGMPVSIYRPGLIMSHSKTGATHTIDYLLVAFRGFLPFKILPEYPRIFDIVPVDYVAEALVHISLQDNNLGKFYHLFNPQPGTISQFCSWIKDFGYEFEIVSFNTARELALQVEDGHPLYPLLPLIRDADPSPQRSLDPLYISEITPDIDCRNTLNLLEDSGITCPPVSRDLAYKCLEYLVAIKFLPKPTKTAKRTSL